MSDTDNELQGLDLDNPVWTDRHIAKLLSCSVSHVQTYVVKLDGFPPARRPEVGNGKRQIRMRRMYEREAVLEWWRRTPVITSKSA